MPASTEPLSKKQCKERMIKYWLTVLSLLIVNENIPAPTEHISEHIDWNSIASEEEDTMRLTAELPPRCRGFLSIHGSYRLRKIMESGVNTQQLMIAIRAEADMMMEGPYPLI